MVAGTSKEHLGFAVALGVPTFVIVTKIDACRVAQVERTLHQLERMLKGPGCRRVPLRVETEDDACTAASNFHSERYLKHSDTELCVSLGLFMGCPLSDVNKVS